MAIQTNQHPGEKQRKEADAKLKKPRKLTEKHRLKNVVLLKVTNNYEALQQNEEESEDNEEIVQTIETNRKKKRTGTTIT